MSYQETLDWMFTRLPMYQRQGVSAYKVDISNTINLAQYLGCPETQFRSVHIAGTNGKGSTSHMLASVLQEAGYTVGLYTSPHLKDFRERIRINGKEINKKYVVDFIANHQPYLEDNQLSFFEMTVGMAFQYFATSNIDIAIIEVGLGGRLDSTNIIIPEVSVITNIGLDHTQFLGETLAEIAIEKGGIIKPNIPVVIGETQKQTEDVFRKLSKENHSKITFADQEIYKTYESDLKGAYQEKNIRTVIQTIKELRLSGFSISETQLKTGLLHVVNNTGLLGRWQVINQQPKVICDTAHNYEGLSIVLQQLQDEDYEHLHIIFGVVSDKNLDSIMGLLPKRATYYLCKPNIPRGMEVNILGSKFIDHGLNINVYNSANEAYDASKKTSKKSDLIFIGGSTFVVAEII